MQDSEPLSHFMYPRCDIKEADAVAWVAINPTGPLEMYPCKFPELEDDQVRLKILYTSICHSDIMTIRGKWGETMYPCCPGHEIVGEVTLVGKDVTTHKKGDIVGVSPIRWCCFKCENCLIGRTNLCTDRVYLYGGEHFGGYCTHMQINHHWAWPIPAGLPLDRVAPILCAGLTVYAPLKRHGKVGDRCAVIGIGGLGHLAVQYANKLGMTVTAFTTKPDRIKQMHALGATALSHSIDKQSLKTQEGNFDIVVNTLFVEDNEVYKAHQRLVAPGGVYIGVGAPDIKCKFLLEHDYLSRYEVKVAGSSVASIEDGCDCLRFSAEYTVLPVCEQYAFEDFNKALHRAEKEGPKFRCVINVTDWAKKNGFDK